MLGLRPVYENCRKKLFSENSGAMICAFKCVYCQNCAKNIFENICRKCSNGFDKRPVRPKGALSKYIVMEKEAFIPADMTVFQLEFNKYKDLVLSSVVDLKRY